jgi:hypothetical protein
MAYSARSAHHGHAHTCLLWLSDCAALRVGCSILSTASSLTCFIVWTDAIYELVMTGPRLTLLFKTRSCRLPMSDNKAGSVAAAGSPKCRTLCRLASQATGSSAALAYRADHHAAALGIQIATARAPSMVRQRSCRSCIWTTIEPSADAET